MREDGYCDSCGAELNEAWLTVTGETLCPECARDRLSNRGVSVKVREERDNER